MEFQFIRDPLYGFRARFNDEHALIGRWLTDELAPEQISELIEQILSLTPLDKELCMLGKEVRATFNHAEALFEAHVLFQQSSELEQYQEDALELEEQGLVACCGREDFISMLNEWAQFIQIKR
ncbi:YacL family protein [Pseudoalteromonas sp. T1lg65]|uniref:YacL family protein n=1 Tax=Pseudoalteromonas sp. T1lg65 TaxID=2077101 RepID=UPI003F79305E